MEHRSQSTSNIGTSARFNVVIRVRPELGDEKNELTTDEDLLPCVSKLVTNKINNKYLLLYLLIY